MVFPCTSHCKIWDLNHGKFTIFTTKSQLLGLFPKEFFIQSRGHEITPICLAGGFKQFVFFQLSIWERFPFLTHIFWRGWFNHQVVVYLGRNQTGWCKWLWRWFWAILGPRKDSAWCMVWLGVILLMDKILHHLGWLKPYKQWDNHHPWWCRILSINSISWPKKHTQKSEEKLSAKKSHANEHRRLLDKARLLSRKMAGWVEMVLDATHVVGIVSAGFPSTWHETHHF